MGLLGFTCWFTWQLARKSMSTNLKDKVFKELFEQVLRLLALLVQKYLLYWYKRAVGAVLCFTCFTSTKVQILTQVLEQLCEDYQRDHPDAGK